eukprot:TRINITY_DN4058_c0_g1_i5.p2 TRINITY_DN4058_c0_g1~~TRINITY_DN4058_c0_g1_i5.p2  ORF type:complete len:156 (-),score=31.34 TRINITY_DN4058_c0_g1_i5:117-584(-)
MGAAAALLYAGGAPDPLIARIIADSPFASFGELFKENAKMLRVKEGEEDKVYSMAVPYIKEKYGVDLDKLNPIEGLEKVKIPALFIHAVNDRLIPAQHSKKIYEIYGGEQEIVNFIGYPPNNAHNAPRLEIAKEKVLEFLKHSKCDYWIRFCSLD